MEERTVCCECEGFILTFIKTFVIICNSRRKTLDLEIPTWNRAPQLQTEWKLYSNIIIYRLIMR